MRIGNGEYRLQARGENRYPEEAALLEWACSESRTQSAQK